jgi:hypothetical protein
MHHWHLQTQIIGTYMHRYVWGMLQMSFDPFRNIISVIHSTFQFNKVYYLNLNLKNNAIVSRFQYFNSKIFMFYMTCCTNSSKFWKILVSCRKLSLFVWDNLCLHPIIKIRFFCWHPSYRQLECRHPNCRHKNMNIMYLLTYPSLTYHNLIYVGYHLTPEAPRSI